MKYRAIFLPVVCLGLWVLGLVAIPAAHAQVPQSKHIWLVTEENHSYENVIGNSSMPYFNSLAKKYGLATEYYSNQHSSLTALMWLVAGQPVTTNNNTTSCFNVNNVVRQLLANGLTWKSYQVDLPYAGFQGLSWLNYLRRHNPLIDFTDACTPAQELNSVPYPQLAADMAKNATPNFAYITPNVQEDAHNGTLAQADTWLSQNVPAILARPEFKPGGDGLLFVVFDEGNLSGDNRCSSHISNGCGGRIATLLIGPQVKPAYQSTVSYLHPNLLRTVCDAMGLVSCPGAAALASPMSDLFNTVNVQAPVANAQVYSPVRIQATTTNSSPVYAMQVYVDHALHYSVAGNAVNTSLPVPLGNHFIVVQSWDKAGGIHKTGVWVNVKSQSVVVNSPTPNAITGSPVNLQASGGGASSVNTMKVYVDGTLSYQVKGGTINTNLALGAGPHKLAVSALDNTGNVTTNTLAVNVQNPSITIASPAANASLYSPVNILTSAQGPSPVKAVKLFGGSSLMYEVTGAGISAPIRVSPGSQTLTVQATDAAGRTFSKQVKVNIKSIPVTASSPLPNASVKSPVAFKATVPSGSPVYAMQIYVDNVCKYTVNAQTISTSLAISKGKHYIVVKAWDTGGGTWTTGFNINVY